MKFVLSDIEMGHMIFHIPPFEMQICFDVFC